MAQGMAAYEDWSLIGTNIRRARCLQGLTQGELARLAGLTVSTIHHAEEGRPLFPHSFEKISNGLGCSVEHIRAQQRSHLTEDMDLLVHRAEAAVWTSVDDRRAKIPKDDLVRIQSSEERSRLGKLGLVPMFACAMTFILPDGPGPVLLELYGRHEGTFNHTIYRDCLLMCTQGRARVEIAERTVALKEGDAVGYRSADLRLMEPEGDLPARLMWVGGARLGRLPTEYRAGAQSRSEREG